MWVKKIGELLSLSVIVKKKNDVNKETENIKMK